MGEPYRDFFAQFKEYLTKAGLSRTTIANYLADVRVFAGWMAQTKGDTFALSNITASDIQDYCQYLQAVKQSPISTINRHLHSIRKLCSFAVDRGLMSSDPAAAVKLFRRPQPLSPRTLDREEVTRLVQTVRQSRSPLVARDHAIIQMLLQTGIRVGELANLRLSDLDLAEKSGMVTVGANGGVQPRRIPLNASARKALTTYLEVRPASAKSDAVFLTRDGRPLSVRSTQQIVSTYAQAAGLTDVSASTLRHTYAAHLLKDSGDLTLVARLLGHRRVETTTKYISPRAEDATEVVEKSSLNVY
jgi:site-specific recombinase XerD